VVVHEGAVINTPPPPPQPNAKVTEVSDRKEWRKKKREVVTGLHRKGRGAKKVRPRTQKGDGIEQSFRNLNVKLVKDGGWAAGKGADS